MTDTSTREPVAPAMAAPLVRASEALLDRLFAPHGPSAYFRWLPSSGQSEAGSATGRADVASAEAPAASPRARARSAAAGARPSQAGVARRSRTGLRSTGTQAPATGTVSFDRSQLTAVAEGTLLETAEAAGLEPRYRCRRGICGTCTTTKLAGTVRDARTGETSDADGPIRICVSVACGDVALDL